MESEVLEQVEATETQSTGETPVLGYEVDTIVDGQEETIIVDVLAGDATVNVSDQGDLWIADDKHDGPNTSRQVVLIVPRGHWTALRRTDCSFE